MKHIFILFLLMNVGNIVAQDVSCEDLTAFVIDKGYLKASLANYTLNSEWLYEVKAYTYEYIIYVVAKIKPNQYSYQTKTYVFCGIPSQNWTKFQYGGYGESTSYGERFHKFIIDYVCDCS